MNKQQPKHYSILNISIACLNCRIFLTLSFDFCQIQCVNYSINCSKPVSQSKMIKTLNTPNMILYYFYFTFWYSFSGIYFVWNSQECIKLYYIRQQLFFNSLILIKQHTHLTNHIFLTLVAVRILCLRQFNPFFDVLTKIPLFN